MKLLVVENFQWNGKIYRAGEKPEDRSISVSKSLLLAEMEKGKHQGTGKYLSPVLNHCVPGDEEAAELLGGTAPEEEKDDTEEIERIRAEFDAIGKAYDRRWQLKRLQTELVKAQKETGE